MAHASMMILEKIADVKKFAEDTVKESVVAEQSNISIHNEDLISYMLQLVKDHPDFYGFYFAAPNGTIIQTINIPATTLTHFITTPEKPLPKDAVFAISFLDKSTPESKEVWIYKDIHFNTLATESTENANFNTTQRPWYIGSVAAKGEIYWTPVYKFQLERLGTPGFTVAQAHFDKDGNLITIIGVDYSLRLFSYILTHLNFGFPGGAFVVDQPNQPVLPLDLPKTGITKDVVHQAADVTEGKYDQILSFKANGVEYLTYSVPFPISRPSNWDIVVIAPVSGFIGELLASQEMIVLISIAILILSSLFVVYFSKKISEPIVILTNEIEKIRRLDFSSEKRVRSNIKEIKLLDDSIAAMRVAIRSFGRYIPKEIVFDLLEQGKELTIGGEKRDVSIIFTDIVGFTPIAESYDDTNKLLDLLEEYFDGMSRIIMENQGNIDKYIGDGIMAFWGAPKPLADHAFYACKTALACQKFVREFNQKMQAEGKPLLNTRIGIDSGEVIIGNIGTNERMNYTAIGNIVNSAARLQGTAKVYHTYILISERTYEKVKDQFKTREVDYIELRGMKGKIHLYELLEN